MSTELEGREMVAILKKYYRGRAIDNADRKILDRLCRASFIEYYRDDGCWKARMSPEGRALKPRILRFPRIVSRH
ncbi:MAG: hypothetical protein Q4Q58_04645 [Thermoplasmata archaeon]|nr:hypothetical protein [Thermoplasmata archaeon]